MAFSPIESTETKDGAQTEGSSPRLTDWLRLHWRWAVPTAVFALVWLAELYRVQGLTLAPDYEGTARFNTFAPIIRLLLDIAFVAGVVVLLNRFWLAVVGVLGSALMLALMTHFQYFYRPLSLVTVWSNWREGVAISEFGKDFIHFSTVAKFASALAVKLIAIAVSQPSPWRLQTRWKIGAVCFAAYAMLFVAAVWIDPLDRIATKRPLGRLGIIRGYTGPWLAELYYLGNGDLLNTVTAFVKENRSDQLTDIEFPIQVQRNLVVVQAESLDFSILGYKANGVEVTPFLNQLRDQSMFYRVRTFHDHGSHGADFTFFSVGRVPPFAHPYQLIGYPYDDCLPKVLKQAGYHSTSLHGNGGAFYNRSTAFERMGFDQILFREQLERDFSLRAPNIGVLDEDVLRVSSQLFRDAKGPMAQFVITLTTHTPYRFLPRQSDDIFPDPSTAAERYFNNMHYLDRCLRDYVVSLPPNTTVVLYADHPALDIKAAGFRPDKVGEREFVPCFIFDTSQNLADKQRTREDPISTNGDLNILDIATYLRHRILAEEKPSTP